MVVAWTRVAAKKMTRNDLILAYLGGRENRMSGIRNMKRTRMAHGVLTEQ
jgi:hypothetical protein